MDTRNAVPTIDPEFAALLVPLTPREEALLRESLQREGCTEPLAVWKGKNVLLDGHARLKLCVENGIPYRTMEVELADREAARQWVWQRQAGRRNLRPVAAAYTAGVLYRSIKKKPGARTDRTSGQKARRWASEDVARVFGLDESTIRRHARLSRAIDAIASELGEEFKRAILTGQARLSRRDIATLVGMSRSEKERHLRNLTAKREGDRAARRKTTAAARPAADEQTGHRRPPESEKPGLLESVTPSTAASLDRTVGEYDPDATASEYRHEDPDDTTRGRDLPPPNEDDVDEAALVELTELFRRANHATRLAFLGQPLVRAALRRLDPALSA